MRLMEEVLETDWMMKGRWLCGLREWTAIVEMMEEWCVIE